MNNGTYILFRTNTERYLRKSLGMNDSLIQTFFQEERIDVFHSDFLLRFSLLIDVSPLIDNGCAECVLRQLYIRDWFTIVHIHQKEKIAL